MLSLIPKHNVEYTVADPGFPVGGCRPVGGCQPPTQILLGKTMCKNERIGSCWGHAGGAPLDPPMIHAMFSAHAVLPNNQNNHHNRNVIIHVKPRYYWHKNRKRNYNEE